MKRLLSLLLFLLLIPNISIAFNLTAPESTIMVPAGGSAEFDVEIFSGIEDNFDINIVESKTWTSFSTTRLYVNESETRPVTVYLYPGLETMLGLYRISFVAESIRTGEKQSREIFISVIKEEIIDIEKIFVTGDLEPVGKINLSVHLKSFKTTTVQDLVMNVRVNSPKREILAFSEIIEKINPDESQIVQKNFYLPEYAEPGTYTVEITLNYEGKSSRTTKNFRVVEKPVIKQEISEFPILGTGKVIAVTNIGNKRADTITITETISDLDKMFFSGSPTSISGNLYTWEIIGLQPGEQATIVYKVDYLALLILIVILMVVLWYIIFKIRTVLIKKNILQKKEIKEGSEFTVGIEVKNNTGCNVKDVSIRDFIPSAFKVKDANGPKPVKRETPMGTELRWKMENFTKGEERIMTYKIIPVFGIYGQVRLPRASVKFKKKGTILESMSSHASVGIASKKQK